MSDPLQNNSVGRPKVCANCGEKGHTYSECPRRHHLFKNDRFSNGEIKALSILEEKLRSLGLGLSKGLRAAGNLVAENTGCSLTPFQNGIIKARAIIGHIGRFSNQFDSFKAWKNEVEALGLTIEGNIYSHPPIIKALNEEGEEQGAWTGYAGSADSGFGWIKGH